MKKIKLLVALCCMTIVSLAATTKINAATGTITLYVEQAFYEVDNRPYAQKLSADCVLTSVGGTSPYTRKETDSYYGAYLTHKIGSPAGWSVKSAHMTYYVNGAYDGFTSKSK